MVSVIICSRNADLLAQVSKNIQETIGVTHEIIGVNNTEQKRGICEVYNEGAGKSKYDILCFIHEDVFVHTKEWGKVVQEVLEDKTIGLLGVAGSIYKTSAPCPWWEPDGSGIRMNIIQHYSGQQVPVHEIKNPHKEVISDVVLVDGVWFCCRKEVWENNKFDNYNFKGFHFYDLDFSAQINEKLRVCVSHKILIEHFSQGTINKEWIANALIYYKKWKNKFPFFVNAMEKNNQINYEWLAHKKFMELLIQYNYKVNIQIKFLIKILMMRFPDKEFLKISKRVFRNFIIK